MASGSVGGITAAVWSKIGRQRAELILKFRECAPGMEDKAVFVGPRSFHTACPGPPFRVGDDLVAYAAVACRVFTSSAMIA
jgi:hypothetical protein